jgi:AraC-like DNA-binding protein
VDVPQPTGYRDDVRRDGDPFAVGVFLGSLATRALVDRGIELPEVTRRTFWLEGGRWEIPAPDDAEALVARLVRNGVIARDPLVAAALRDSRRPTVSERTFQRRFRAATGLTQGAVRQIGRARAAATLLASGTAVQTAVVDLGYYDEPHLARALRRYVGRTPGQLREGRGGALALDPAQRTTSYTSLATPLA